jgi:hypothetical protein
MKDWKFIAVYVTGVALVLGLFVSMAVNIRNGNAAYDKRYAQCIKADKQWIDGNCINK